MGNDNLRMRLEPRLDPPGFPIPKHDISITISATNPPSVRGEADLTRVSGDAVPCESFLAVLAEIVG
jgi:hypothetical protein